MIATLITSELHTATTIEAATAWRSQLHRSIAELPPGSLVRLLVDQTGYRPATLSAHRLVRMVVPELLATHGMRSALADLYPTSRIRIEQHPAVRIEAFAMVHHDAEKMTYLDRRVGRRDQRFFDDRAVAERWLRNR